MKKILLCAALVISAVSFGQKKSDKFVSGTVSYTKLTDVKGTYSVIPTIGYYLTDRVSVGVLGEVGKSSTEKTTDLGVFGRCDFMNVGKKCEVFSQLSLMNNSTTLTDSTESKTECTSVTLGLGANYSITKRLSLTVHLTDLIGYTTQDSKSILTVGFSGINNPISASKFGLLYRF
jgi:hypothetical protein